MNELPFTLEQPLAFQDARKAAHTFATQRREGRAWLERAHKDLAEAERDYRKARAEARVKVEAATAGERDDLIDSTTADERYERDVARGVLEAAKEFLREVDATRASFHALMAWSMKVDPAAEEDRSAGHLAVAS